MDGSEEQFLPIEATAERRGSPVALATYPHARTLKVCRHDCITQATDGKQNLLIPLPQPTCLPPAEGLSPAFTSAPCLGKLQGTGISPQLTSLPVDLNITAGVGWVFQ